MEEFFQVGKGDLLPALRIQALTRINGKKVPLPGLSLVDPVAFYMRVEKGGALKINGAVAIVEDATNAILRYDWQVGDTDTPEHYDAEFKVTIAGKPVTIPNDDLNDGQKINVWVTEDVP